MSIRRNAQGASSLGEINDRLREVLLIGQRHGGIGGFGGVETLSVGVGENRGEKRDLEHVFADLPDLEYLPDLTEFEVLEVLEGLLNSGVTRDNKCGKLTNDDIDFEFTESFSKPDNVPTHISTVIEEHVTRINSCYFEILEQVRQAFNAEHPRITIDSILIHFATIFIAYYLTFAISPSFMDVLAPSSAEHKDVTRSALEFWREKLESHYKTPPTPVSFDEFNRITKLALNFVWWSHNFEEVCRQGAIQKPLAKGEEHLVSKAMLSILRELPNAAEKAPTNATTNTYLGWRIGWSFASHYELTADTRDIAEQKEDVSVMYPFEHRKTNKLVVVKLFNTEDQVVPRDVYREISIMQNLATKEGDGREYLLSLYKSQEKPQVFLEGNVVYMVMDKCLYDLDEWRKSLLGIDNGCVPRDDRMAIIKQLASALKHMHAKNKNIPPVIHTDVKLGNIFVVQTRPDPGGLKIKLADFGFSSYLTTVGPINFNAGISFRTSGTPGYYPPEIYTGAGAGTASDMYCAGAVHARLLGMQTDCLKIRELFMKGIDGKKVKDKGALLAPFRHQTRDCSDKEWELLLTQLSEDPAQRLPAEQVLDLTFITAQAQAA